MRKRIRSETQKNIGGLRIGLEDLKKILLGLTKSRQKEQSWGVFCPPPPPCLENRNFFKRFIG